MQDRSRALPTFIAGTTAIIGLTTVLSIWNLHRSGPGNVDVSALSDTKIVAHPNTPLDPNENVIWCDTINLAWNEAIKYLHAPLQFNPSNPLADILNKQEFTTSDLDPESYVVAAGKKTDSINQSFRDELHHKFGNSVSPPLLDSSDPPATSEDIAIYAFLLKNLLFADPFDTNAPMSFGWTKVASFGFGHEVSPGSGAPPNLTSEVRLLRYSSQDDFIIQIRTKSDGEQLVLAKITPAKTLEETIAIVLPTIKPTAIWGLDEKDKLAIPKIDFDLTAHFKELEGKSFDGGRINTAAENIVFRLNEKRG